MLSEECDQQLRDNMRQTDAGGSSAVKWIVVVLGGGDDRVPDKCLDVAEPLSTAMKRDGDLGGSKRRRGKGESGTMIQCGGLF